MLTSCYAVSPVRAPHVLDVLRSVKKFVRRPITDRSRKVSKATMPAS